MLLAFWSDVVHALAAALPTTCPQVFRTIARTPSKEFLLRLSMMEIYNEVGG